MSATIPGLSPATLCELAELEAHARAILGNVSDPIRSALADRNARTELFSRFAELPPGDTPPASLASQALEWELSEQPEVELPRGHVGADSDSAVVRYLAGSVL